MRRIVLVVAALGSVTASVSAQDWSDSRPDSHAPLGVMGDHLHERGEWMVSFRYMRMGMEGNRDDSGSLSTSDVLERYPVAPTRMSQDMSMVGFMFAPTDRLTMMATVPILNLSMEHLTRTGTAFTTAATGVGDLTVSALFGILEPPNQRWHLNIGFALPTGSVDKRDDTPAGLNQQLPYPMQLGSGTIDFKPGITYLGQRDDLSWGAQGMAVIRTGENDHEYGLGHRFAMTGWGARRFNDTLSFSLRADVQFWDSLKGADPLLDRAIAPTADPMLRGGTRFSLLPGANIYIREGFLADHRLSLEAGFPVYQRLDGPQLENNWQFVIGWQKSFG